MILILEGSDGTFKTTVALGLSNKLGITVVPGSSFESAKLPNRELFQWYLGKIAGGDTVIFDRFFYSNLVYAKLFPGYSILTTDQVKLLEAILYQLHETIFLVYLVGDLQDIKNRIGVRGDNYIKVNKVKSILDQYERVMARNVGLPYITVDTSRFTSEEIVNFIIQRLGRETIEWPQINR